MPERREPARERAADIARADDADLQYLLIHILILAMLAPADRYSCAMALGVRGAMPRVERLQSGPAIRRIKRFEH